MTAYSIMPMNSGKDYKARVTEVSQPLMAGGPVGGNQGGDFVLHGGASVRRLTPNEYECLQGFPRGWTDIDVNGSPPTSRYKSVGNSMAIPVMSWIASRIQNIYTASITHPLKRVGL